MYKEKYGFSEPPKQLVDAFARVGIQYKVHSNRPCRRLYLYFS